MKELYYLKAADNPKKIAEIAGEAIQTVYPRYYPPGAVDYFLNYHSLDNIREAFENEEIYLFFVEDRVVGTGSIRNNEICRLFILPKFQRKGYGSRFMDMLEERIFTYSPSVHVDASFPAEAMYLKRGYEIVSFQTIETGCQDFLCYHTMEKRGDENDIRTAAIYYWQKEKQTAGNGIW